ncbi:MAG: GTP cyclohydrolase I FolE [Omnitrophica bacterium RIFCSPLOWO2_01_FULL_50_24]|nr:MAG: GTP cyclohydrolase I FolE [Omnitrophica bacterium RIFCSPLOWO2_01_FULL_50_24]
MSEVTDRIKIDSIIRDLLIALGEDPSRAGLERTPERVEASLKFLTRGYRQDIEQVLNGAIFEEDYDEMVLVKEIDFFSLCEHHLLPFYGRAHVAYLPQGKIIGLSKIPRVVDVFSRRLQVQERLTNQIAQCLMQHLKPKGVAVVMEAFHMCMAMRGVEKKDSFGVTSAMLGCFRTDPRSRSEFLSLIGKQK